MAKIADELTLILHRVRTKGKATVFKSLKQAVLTIWKHSKIENTVQRLESIRAEVQFRILVSMMEKVDKNELKKDGTLQSLDDSTREILDAVFQGKLDLTAIVATQTRESIKREDAREAAAIKRHKEIKTYLVGQNIPAGQDLDTAQVLCNIKNRLDFARIADRYDVIKLAYKDTFDWVFQSSSEQRAPRDNKDGCILDQR
jgi:hypothetical protein